MTKGKRALPKGTQAAFLAAYSKTGNITRAAKLSGTARSQHYEWMRDGEYAEAFAQANAEACELLESEARRRAMQGVDEPVVYQGGFTYPQKKNEEGEWVPDYKAKPLTIRKYSDTLLIFLMKGAMPNKYRDNATVEVKGNVSLIERLAAGRKRLAQRADEPDES